MSEHVMHPSTLADLLRDSACLAGVDGTKD